MRTASELEAAHARTPVRLSEKGNTGAGVLSLDGPRTQVTLSAEHYFRERSIDSGWFDLTLEEHNGEKILLHNALTTSSSVPHNDRREWQYRIFPNIVVLNAGALQSGSRVREIRFTAQGLEDIFSYEIAEWQSLYRADKETLAQIKALRKRDRAYPRGYAYFSPMNVYLIHSLPRVLRERVGNKTYEIFLGHSEKHGRKSLTIESMAVATIRFADAVGIDDALDAAWAWRRFFHQIAMRPLPYTTLACRGGTKRTDRHADLYLPNLESIAEHERTGMFDFSSRDVPYGGWKHRKKFASVMREWLKRDDRRDLFRIRIDRVIERMQAESSPKLVADLCSAIESLGELRAPLALSNDNLKLIVDAAAKAGEAISPPVKRDRLEGLLTLLQH